MNRTSLTQKIVVYGGSFSPPHWGHIAIVQALISKKIFDKIIIVPSYHHPYNEKAKLIPFYHRIKMLSYLTAIGKNIIVSNIESQFKKASYTYLMLQKIREKYPNRTYYFALGMDTFNNIHLWKNFEWFVKNNIHFLVFIRKSAKNTINSFNQANKVAQKYYSVQKEIIPDISSTNLKLALQKIHKKSQQKQRETFTQDNIRNFLQEIGYSPPQSLQIDSTFHKIVEYIFHNKLWLSI